MLFPGFHEWATSGIALQIAGSQVRLRPASDTDRDFLRQVYARSRDEELAAVPWPGDEKERFLTAQFLAQDRYYHEQYPGAEYWIVLADDQPAGRLYLHDREKELRIMDITLMPPWRRQGIGRFLLRSLLQDARETQRQATIHVELFNPARCLYEQLGFRVVAEHGLYLFMAWTPQSNG
ncbi:MAG TPA: GNAT family N-acetyltransferase [Candidatus Paceibacterota bacterium]|nr:GNAT family N-acetyltransferase [Verrucomicrobiota bacterium]HRY49206.1 GNAT family N-acetyltransferase [Candidatus Paceibacterota bacterium]HSA03100.1 GNAT family N-acetyltransferase [Candidatus Paceibacterota bacterium]